MFSRIFNFFQNLWARMFHSDHKKTRVRVKSGYGVTRRSKKSRLTRAELVKSWCWQKCKKILFAGVAIFAAWFLYMWLSLPSIDSIDAKNKNPGIVIRDDKGTIISSYGDVYGTFVTFDKLPKSLIYAVLATEDRNFYHHLGFDPIGMTRAMVANMRAGQVVQGGSTITQQLAKNVFLSPERTLSRKLRELLMAFKIEMYFSKQEILAIYLNRVYFGAGNFGVDAASRRYFGKPATEMTLAESAVMTGLLKAPSKFAPTSNPKLAHKRAEQVLLNMIDADYLKESQKTKAMQQLSALLAKRAPDSPNSYYFTDWIVDELPNYIGDIKQDIDVYSTMNGTMQVLAEKAISGTMNTENAAKLGASQAALLVMKPDGAVKAIMGGVSYSKSQYNRAVQSKRQPGSAFKLFVYLNALEQGAWPDMMVEDRPVSVGKWSPGNYTGDYKGMMTLRDAVAQSINSVAVQMSEAYGRGNVVAMARSLGVTSKIEPTPSVALGSYEVSLIEMVTAYAHLASNGEKVVPYGIKKIVTKKGKVLYERKDTGGERVLSQRVVGMANDMFSGVIGWGTGTRANIGRSAAGKTGTTSDYKDAWFIGYTPDLVAGVWVGNDAPKPMKKVTGGNLPAAIWKSFMQPALIGTPESYLPTSAGGAPDGTDGAGLPWGETSGSGSENTPANDVDLGSSFWEKLGIQ